jgi:hypothetical protein
MTTPNRAQAAPMAAPIAATTVATAVRARAKTVTTTLGKRKTAAAGPRASARLVRDIVGCWRSQALNAAVELGVAERLAGGPRAPRELAEALGCDADGLTRLLRALCVLEVCRERADGRIGLTRAGRLLCSEPGEAGTSLRPLVQWWGGALWPMWAELGYSVRTGQSARRKLTGDERYAHLDKSAAMAQTFHDAQSAMTSLVLDDLAAWDGWRTARHVVDVGGGHGQVALALLARHPRLRATVFDLPHAQAGALARIAQCGAQADTTPATSQADPGGGGRVLGPSGPAARCTFVPGSFLESIPAGADRYVLKSILHNWDDAHCAVFLGRLRAAMGPGAVALVVDRVRPERLRRNARDEAVVRTDLNMLAGLGGRERSLAEFRALLGAAGLDGGASWPLGFEFSAIEVRARP